MSNEELIERIESLEQQVASLKGVTGELRSPRPRIFLARAATEDDDPDAPATGFVEQTVDVGEVADCPGGRKSLADGDASNLIEPGDAFAVMEIEDVDEGGNRVTRFVPIRSSSVVTVQPTTNLAGGGKYRGKIVQGSIAPTVTQAAWEAADFQFPEDGESLPADEDCYVVNRAEAGDSTHSLTLGSEARRNHLGVRAGTAPDGLPIIMVYSHGVFDAVV